MRVRHWILIAALIAGFGCRDDATSAADSGAGAGGKGVSSGVDAATDDASHMSIDAEARDASGMAEVSGPCEGGTDGVIDGSYRILDPADAAAIAGCKTIKRNLTVDATALTSLSLPLLTTVGGYFAVSGNPALTSLSLPLLTTIGAYLAGGSFEVSDNTALTSLSVPVLMTVATFFTVSGNPALTSLSLPSLATVGKFNGTGFYVGDNTALTSLSAPVLTTVTDFFRVGDNTGLTALSLPVLTTVVREFIVDNNAALETSLAQAVRNQLAAPPLATTMICGNKSGTACP